MTNVVIDVRRSTVPGLPEAIVRFYLEEEGKRTELTKTAGCDRHLVTRDGNRHFCVCPEGFRELDPTRNTVKWLCLEVCEHQKDTIRNLLTERGQWMDEKTKEAARRFLSRENTVDWK